MTKSNNNKEHKNRKERNEIIDYNCTAVLGGSGYDWLQNDKGLQFGRRHGGVSGRGSKVV